MLSSISLDTWAQFELLTREEWLGLNVVRVESASSSGPGFGFVVYQDQSSLYIVTARHVVANAHHGVGEFEVHELYFGRDGLKGELVYLDSMLDLAIIKIGFKDFPFVRAPVVSRPDVDDRVGVIGFDLAIEPTPRKLMGKIISIREGIIEFELDDIKEGCSGGPLVDQHGIVGMVFSDNPMESSKAIAIDTVMSVVSRRLRFENNKVRDYPSLMVAILGGVSGQMKFQRESKSNYTSLTYGLLGEINFNHRLAFRYRWQHYRMESGTPENVNGSYKFLNTFTANYLGLVYYPFQKVEPSYLGISGFVAPVRSSQEVLVDGVWKEFDEATGLPSAQHSFLYGVSFLGNASLPSGLSFGLEMSFMLPSDKYLLVDVDEPITSSDGRELMYDINIFVGYRLGWKRTLRIGYIR